ncbi:hypothetical protein RDI58_027660 [Solanum bulbocastanum]|uniref:Neprosin PEP catalytic domain-containing protein n=1 Tax=Solanum bulbocastanum TaxID=147425 RepID=A0AAN8SZ92_SOLBU
MITRNPHVEEDDEYSTPRLTLKSGSYYNFQDIESGWTVNPRVYGDRQTRLFTYWTIFEGGLEVHAETVQWGGEVYSKNVGKHPHTKTQMGSGAFPFYIFANTGFMKYMRILDNTMELRFPQNVVAYSEEYDCYRTQYVGDYIEEPEFHFGGPGRNPLCP